MEKIEHCVVIKLSVNKGLRLTEIFNDMKNVLGDVVPVSYTHLDVYKRQPIQYLGDVICLEKQTEF